jgi:hypothetical protein
MLAACRLAGLSALEADIRAFTPTRNQDTGGETLRPFGGRESLAPSPGVPCLARVSCKRVSRPLASRSAALTFVNRHRSRTYTWPTGVPIARPSPRPTSTRGSSALAGHDAREIEAGTA